MKNNAYAIIFHTTICLAGTTNSIYRRAKSEILLAIPPALCACGTEIIMNNNKLSDFKYGFKKGIPIAMGYIPVSFSFGFMAVNGGLPIWLAVLISVTNLTSSGQLAGTNLIIHGGTLLEITLNTFIINLR